MTPHSSVPHHVWHKMGDCRSLEMDDVLEADMPHNHILLVEVYSHEVMWEDGTAELVYMVVQASLQ